MTCPAEHPTAACRRYGSAYIHAMIRRLWAAWLAEQRGQVGRHTEARGWRPRPPGAVGVPLHHVTTAAGRE